MPPSRKTAARRPLPDVGQASFSGKLLGMACSVAHNRGGEPKPDWPNYLNLHCFKNSEGLSPEPLHVSIRAPARGATHHAVGGAGDLRVSIRAPARGATSQRPGADQEIRRFDPRSRAGSDSERPPSQSISSLFRSALPRGERQRKAAESKYKQPVSIRAPARGATIARACLA